MDPVRQYALETSLRWLEGQRGTTLQRVLADARAISSYLEGRSPAVFVLRRGPVFKQSGQVSTNQPKGHLMQLHDDEQVTYSIEGDDAKGFEVTGESFTATSSDETVVAVTQDGASFAAVAGNPGSATLTFTDGTLSVTESIDVVPGDVATLKVTAGEVTKQAPSA